MSLTLLYSCGRMIARRKCSPVESTSGLVLAPVLGPATPLSNSQTLRKPVPSISCVHGTVHADALPEHDLEWKETKIEEEALRSLDGPYGDTVVVR